MTVGSRIDRALQEALQGVSGPRTPPGLVAATRHAVFPGGARIRPRLCLAVAGACGDDQPVLSLAAATAVELMHCASLVHDDLPCFDDAPTRRGQPSVHARYGERLAVLAGDALMVLAFQVLARHGGSAPERLARLVGALGDGIGMPEGIIAGQAWECEPAVPLNEYQRAKTAALFVTACRCGALAAGAPAQPWESLGAALGEAYQVADDIRDLVADAAAIGKPTGQDASHGRPNAATQWGMAPTVRRFRQLVTRAVDAIPSCRGRAGMQALVRSEGERLVPTTLCRQLIEEAAA